MKNDQSGLDLNEPRTRRYLISEILGEAAACGLILYVLSSCTYAFRSHPFFIFLFAGQIWVFGRFWENFRKICKRRAAAVIIMVLISAAVVGTACIFGLIDVSAGFIQFF